MREAGYSVPPPIAGNRVKLRPGRLASRLHRARAQLKRGNQAGRNTRILPEADQNEDR